METIPERLEPEPLPLEDLTLAGLGVVGSETVAVDEPLAIDPPPLRTRTRRRRRAFELTVTRQDVLAVLTVYFATRGLLLLAAYLLSAFGHHDFLHELANWDGLWYREVANNGYLHHPSYRQTTLGFFPLYPLVIWIVEPVFTLLTVHGAIWASTVAGVLISTIGGAVATYLVYRLATEWWDRRVGFKAAVLFAVFPGSVVFSMVYSEGLLLPLAAGCLLALGRRRWLLAGILAGFATAVQPVGIVLVPACAIAAILEWRRSGWQRPVLRKVVVAPLLSLTGLCAFGAFLWAWTGTPLANYQAQHHGWSEKTDLLAMLHLTTRLWAQITHAHVNEKPVDLNLIVGLVGGILLAGMLVLVWRQRHRIPPAALVWTAGISFLALTSEYVPPLPRMVITAFPALMVVALYVRGKWWPILIWTNCVLLVVLSMLTFYGVTLRP
jgi:Mannosyltransferase (PIG-V)